MMKRILLAIARPRNGTMVSMQNVMSTVSAARYPTKSIQDIALFLPPTRTIPVFSTADHLDRAGPGRTRCSEQLQDARHMRSDACTCRGGRFIVASYYEHDARMCKRLSCDAYLRARFQNRGDALNSMPQ
jgi:hypothetical protein